jgi:hypothetical protein
MSTAPLGPSIPTFPSTSEAHTPASDSCFITLSNNKKNVKNKDNNKMLGQSYVTEFVYP